MKTIRTSDLRRRLHRALWIHPDWRPILGVYLIIAVYLYAWMAGVIE